MSDTQNEYNIQPTSQVPKSDEGTSHLPSDMAKDMKHDKDSSCSKDKKESESEDKKDQLPSNMAGDNVAEQQK